MFSYFLLYTIFINTLIMILNYTIVIILNINNKKNKNLEMFIISKNY